MSVRGGPYSQVFEGRWLGEKKVWIFLFTLARCLTIYLQVALKTLRILDENDPKTKRLQMVCVPPISIFCSVRVKSPA